ncbi:MAG: hypothetical protein V1676_07090 [Candidatus Diapherotrites archaeon]
MEILKRRQTYGNRLDTYMKRKPGRMRHPIFLKQNPKGELIYPVPKALEYAELPKPIKLGQHIGNKGERPPFTLANVEWIRKTRMLKMGGCDVGYPNSRRAIYSGKIKFLGKSQPEKVIVKEIVGGFTSHKPYGSFIEMLDKGGVPHPKMAAFQLWSGRHKNDMAQYVVMEPFLSKGSTKFHYVNEDLVRALDLGNGFDRDIFRQVAEHTAAIAKAGLRFEPASTMAGELRVDLFNVIRLKGGTPKVFVQDLDTLNWGVHSPQLDWEHSCKTLLAVINNANKANNGAAKKIIGEAAKKHGLNWQSA